MDDQLNPEMPIVETYRGVGIHAFQSQERIDSVVKPEIDQVFTIDEPENLWQYVLSAMNAPEARIWAGAKLTAMIEQRAHKRLPLLSFTVAHVRAAIAGLSSHWADPSAYCSLFDRFAHREAAPRPAEYGRALEEYFRKIERDRLMVCGWRSDGNGKLRAPGDTATAVSAG